MLKNTRFGDLLLRRKPVWAYELGGSGASAGFGSNRPLTVVGSPGSAYGKYGRCATFAGTADAYTLPQFRVKRGISFGVRFKYTATTASMTLLDFPLSVSGGTVIYLRVNENATGKVGVAGIAPLFTAYSPANGYNDGVWHSAVCVFGSNSGTANLYVDGKLVATSAGLSIADYTTDFPRIGSERWFGSNYAWFNGNMADAFCVDSILSQQDILLYHSDTAKQGSDQDDFFVPTGSGAKPWLYRRSSSVSRPYLQVA